MHRLYITLRDGKVTILGVDNEGARRRFGVWGLALLKMMKASPLPDLQIKNPSNGTNFRSAMPEKAMEKKAHGFEILSPSL